MTDFHWKEVDGVTTVWAEAAGPLRAGLLFRAGRADETLATAGHIHLIEHMTLSAMGSNNPMSNGFVGDQFAGFVIAGTPADVSAFLAGICKHLQQPSAARLEAEKQILTAESAARHYDFRAGLLASRYGANGHGLLGMPELGVRGATMEQLEERRVRYFTRENAILWLSGPLPADLRLTLPAGSKHPPKPLSPIAFDFPAWAHDQACGGIAVGATVPRISASSVFCSVVQKRLHERLRMQQAVSYSPMVIYDHISADTAHLILFADSDPNRREDLTRAFGEAYEGLTAFEEAELEFAKNQYREHTVGPLAPPADDLTLFELQRAANDWLLGRKFETVREILEEVLQVTMDEVVAFADGARKCALFAVPPNVEPQAWMGKKISYPERPLVSGREAASVDAPIQTQRLVSGKEGVSVRFDNGGHFTIQYSELAAAVHYDDGGVHLIGSDARWIPVEPLLWKNGAALCKEIYGRVPAHLRVEQGVRPADQIPKPMTTPWQRFRARFKFG